MWIFYWIRSTRNYRYCLFLNSSNKWIYNYESWYSRNFGSCYKKIVEKYEIPIRYIEGASNIETVTPTGLSILASIANFDRSINIKPSNFGVGLGTKNFEKFPNVLTVTLGSDNPKENIVSMKTLLETNIDDMSPEIAGSLIDQAHSLGALDCWISSYYGKKNRPGDISYPM